MMQTTFTWRYSRTVRQRACTFILWAGLAACTSSAPVAPTEDALLHVKIIAFNDFHGYLEAPAEGIRVPDPGRPQQDVTLAAGGVARMATLVRKLSDENPDHVVVGAGDLVGASPLLSGLFLDEPSIEAMNLLGLEISSVGNHEFDLGVAELRRKQFGGCSMQTHRAPCQAGHVFSGARFTYLAANVIDRATGLPVFPPYAIKHFEGLPIAFIGVTLKGTADIVSPAGIVGIEFRDEAQTINALLPELRRQGIHAFVVLIHQGGRDPGRFNDPQCEHFSGDIDAILARLDRDIKVVISGHTHQAYVCERHGVLLTSAASYGRLVTDINLDLDRTNDRVVAAHAQNRVVVAESPARATGLDVAPIPADAAMQALVEDYAVSARPLADRVVGQLATPLTRLADGAVESSLGEVVADAQLEATRVTAGAQLAMTNPGGLRHDLDADADGSVSFGALFAAQPFGNDLVTLTLSGAQLRSLLESQWQGSRSRPLWLQISHGLSYVMDGHRTAGERIVPGTLMLDGVLVGDEEHYRITVNSFLAAGGDGFKVLTEGSERVIGVADVDALEAYVHRHSPVQKPVMGRVVVR